MKKNLVLSVFFVLIFSFIALAFVSSSEDEKKSKSGKNCPYLESMKSGGCPALDSLNQGNKGEMGSCPYSGKDEQKINQQYSSDNIKSI
ncbi:MAG: hypothetical protein HXY49_02745 [Ignavibacteriaceae bacterium]|nr:hypothetical protein [Ignavibacteriaceae bacterium]